MNGTKTYKHFIHLTVTRAPSGRVHRQVMSMVSRNDIDRRSEA